jgi:hypothetical protein
MGLGKTISGIVIAIIIVVAGAVIGFAVTNKPLVDYTIESPASLWDFKFGALAINLGIRNRGGIDASLSLVATVSNAVVSSNQSEPSPEFNQTVLKIPTIAINGQKDYAYYTVFVTPNLGMANFTISYTVERNMGDLMSSFAQIVGWTPTTLTYNRTDTTTYTLITST